jgi:hypothetical protein
MILFNLISKYFNILILLLVIKTKKINTEIKFSK